MRYQKVTINAMMTNCNDMARRFGALRYFVTAFVLLFSLGIARSGKVVPTAVLNLQDETTISKLNWSTNNSNITPANKCYYSKSEKVFVMSSFIAYQSKNNAQKSSSNEFDWIAFDSGNSTALTKEKKWTAPANTKFKGAAYFWGADGAFYQTEDDSGGKVNHENGGFHAATIRSEARNHSYRVTHCTGASLLYIGNDNVAAKLEAYEIVNDGFAETPVKTVTGQNSTSPIAVSIDGLDSNKEYVIVVSGTSTSNTTFCEIAFDIADETPSVGDYYGIAEEQKAQKTPEGWNAVQLPQIELKKKDFTLPVEGEGALVSGDNADNAAVIQAAIDAANTAGGGKVIIPAGTWFSGPITMKSNVVLHLSENTTLKMLPFPGHLTTSNGKDGKWPITWTTEKNNNGKYEASTTNFINSGSEVVNDIIIEGEGETSVLDGNGAAWWPECEKEDVGDYNRPKVIRIETGARHLFRNFKVQNSPAQNIMLGRNVNNRANNVTVHDVTISNPDSKAETPSHNTDGISVWAENVNIYNCNISTGDDNVVCDDNSKFVHVWDVKCGTGHGMSFGSNLKDVHDIIYEDITFTGTQAGFRLKSAEGKSGNDKVSGTGAVKNIICRNSTMTGVPSPIKITSWYDADKENPEDVSSNTNVTATTPEFCNITFQNITAEAVAGKTNWKSNSPIYIYGTPGVKIHDITFDNVKINSKRGAYFAYCDNIKFINGSDIVNETAPALKFATFHEATNVTGIAIPAKGDIVYKWTVPTEIPAEGKNTQTYTGSLGEVTTTYTVGTYKTSDSQEKNIWDNAKERLRFNSGNAKITIALPEGQTFKNGDVINYVFADGSTSKASYLQFKSEDVTVDSPKETDDEKTNTTKFEAVLVVGEGEGQFNIDGKSSFTIERKNATVDLYKFDIIRPTETDTTPEEPKPEDPSDGTVEERTATWDFKTMGAGEVKINGTTGTVASDEQNGLELNVDARTGKLYSRGSDAQFNTGAVIKVPVRHKDDVVTVVSYPNCHNYTVAGKAADNDNTVHTVTAEEAERGYIEIVATGGAYLYSISVKQIAYNENSGIAVVEGNETVSVEAGQDYTLTKDVDYTTESKGTITFETSDESVATVDATGKIHAVKAGNAVITISQAADGSKPASSCQIAVTVPGKLQTWTFSKEVITEAFKQEVNANCWEGDDNKSDGSTDSRGFGWKYKQNTNGVAKKFTYHGDDENESDLIPQFKGLQFISNGAGKIIFYNENKEGLYIDSQNSQIVIPDLKKDQKVTVTYYDATTTAATTLKVDGDNVTFVKTSEGNAKQDAPGTFEGKVVGDGTLKFTYGDQKIFITKIEVENVPNTRKFKDFKVDFRSNPYTVVTPSTGRLPKGVTIEGGSFKDGQHGIQSNAVVTVPVDGPVKFTIGGCQYTNNKAKVSIDGGEAEEIDVKSAGCDNASGYDNFATYTYNVEKAAVLKFTLADYCPYFIAEQCDFVPSVEVSYFNTDGKLIGQETVAGNSKLAYKYGEANVTVPEGQKFRGWFSDNSVKAVKVAEGMALTEDINLYAKATDVEVAEVGKTYDYALNKDNFYSEDHELLVITNGAFHDATHGWSFGDNAKVEIKTKTHAKITFSLCGYGNGGDITVTRNGDNQDLGKFAAKKASDGALHEFYYTQTTQGTEETLVFSIPKSTYIHSIKVEYVDKLVKPLTPSDPTWDGEKWTVGKTFTDENNNNKVINWTEAKDTDKALALVHALEYVATNKEDGKNKHLFIPNGTYDLGIKHGTEVKTGMILEGESQDGVIIKNSPEAECINATSTLSISGDNVQLKNMTVKCRAPYGTDPEKKSQAERGICIEDKGNNISYNNVTLDGLQDTYYKNTKVVGSTSEFYNCIIRGNVDFICGSGNVTFTECNLQIVPTHKASGGYPVVCAPATYTDEEQGFLFKFCTIEASTAPIDCSTDHAGKTENISGNYYLARGWYAGNGTDRTPRATFVETRLNDVKPREQKWGTMIGKTPSEDRSDFKFTNDRGTEDTDPSASITVLDEPFGYAAYFSRNKVENEAARTVNVGGVNISKVTGGGADSDGIYTTEQAVKAAGQSDINALPANETVNGTKKVIRLVANSMEKDKNGHLDGTILNAIKDNDVIIFDGVGGDFEFYNYITLERLAHKTLLGVNNARLSTHWYMTPTVKAMLDKLNVKNASTEEGTGGSLKDPKTGKEIEYIKEAAEYLTRSVILDNVGNEDYRNSGIFNIVRCANFVIRNLKFIGPGSCDAAGYDLTTLEDSHFFWVDHCEFVDGLDGNMDIKRHSDFITVSWTQFRYTDRSYVHQNTNLIGHQDAKYSMKPLNLATMTQGAEISGGTDDTGYLNITWAYDHWGNDCHERMPMVRYGKNHVLNCYYSSKLQGTKAIDARKDSEVLVKNSYFLSSIQKKFTPGEAKVNSLPKAYKVIGNTNQPDATGKYATAVDGSDEVTMPYELEPMKPLESVSAANVPNIIGAGAGATLGSGLNAVLCNEDGTIIADYDSEAKRWYLGEHTDDHIIESTLVRGVDTPVVPLFVTGAKDADGNDKKAVGYVKVTGSNLSSGNYDIDQYLPGLDVDPGYITVADDGRIYKLDSEGNKTDIEGQIFKFTYTPDRDREKTDYEINFVIGAKMATMPIRYGRASDVPVIVQNLKDEYNIVPGKSHTLTVKPKVEKDTEYKWYKVKAGKFETGLVDKLTSLNVTEYADVIEGATAASYDFDVDAKTATKGDVHYLFCGVTKNSATVFSKIAKFTVVPRFALIDFEGSYTQITADNLPEGVTMTGTTKIDAIPIDNAKTSFWAPKLGNGFWSPVKNSNPPANKYAHNTVTLTYSGGFRAGDVITVYGYIKHDNPWTTDNTGGKYGIAEIYTRKPAEKDTVDADRFVAWQVGNSFLNTDATKGVAGNPNYPTEEMLKSITPVPVAGNCVTYTLKEEDIAKIQKNGGEIYLGRLGNTGVSLSKILVTRGESDGTPELTIDKKEPLSYSAYSYSKEKQKRMFRIKGENLKPGSKINIVGQQQAANERVLTVTAAPIPVTEETVEGTPMGTLAVPESGNFDDVFTVEFTSGIVVGHGERTIGFKATDKNDKALYAEIKVNYDQPQQNTEIKQKTLSGPYTWDFANAFTTVKPITLTDGSDAEKATNPSSTEEFILARLPEVKNDGDFFSDYLLFKGDAPIAVAGDCALAKTIKFTTKVSGTVQVKFASNDVTKDTYLTINGKLTDENPENADHTTANGKDGAVTSRKVQIDIDKGEVEKEICIGLATLDENKNVVQGDANSNLNIRIYSITFTPDPTSAPIIDQNLQKTYVLSTDAEAENHSAVFKVKASNVRTCTWYRTNSDTPDFAKDEKLGVCDSLEYTASEQDASRTFYIYCVMENKMGSVTSQVAQVTVKKPNAAGTGTDYTINFSEWDAASKANNDLSKYYAAINDEVKFICDGGRTIEVDSNEKTFEGVKYKQRAKFDGNSYIEFPVEGPCDIKVYWVAGGDGRYLQLKNEGQKLLSESSNKATVKNIQYIENWAYDGEKGRLRLNGQGGTNYVFVIDIKYKNVAPDDIYKWDMADWKDLHPDATDDSSGNTSKAKFPADGTSVGHAATKDGQKFEKEQMLYYGGQNMSFIKGGSKTFEDKTEWTYSLNTGGQSFTSKTIQNDKRAFFEYDAPGKGTITVYGQFVEAGAENSLNSVCIRSGRPLDADAKKTELSMGETQPAENAPVDFIATYDIPAAGPVYIWFPNHKVNVYGIVAKIKPEAVVVAGKPSAVGGVYDVEEKKFTVNLTAELEDATVYYTTDGSNPTKESAGKIVAGKEGTKAQDFYPKGTLNLKGNTVLKAITVKNGYENSEVMTYTVPADPAPQGNTTSEKEAYNSGAAASDKDYIDIAYTIPGTYVAGTGGNINITEDGTTTKSVTPLKLRLTQKNLEGKFIDANTKGVTIRVNPGYVITKVEAHAVSNDSYTCNISAIYVDKDAQTNVRAGANSLNANDGNGPVKFWTADGMLAKERIDIVFEQGKTSASSPKANGQGLVYLNVYYEVDDEVTSLDVKYMDNGADKQKTYSANENQQEWEKFIAGETLELGECDLNPVLTLNTKMGYQYTNADSDNSDWTVTIPSGGKKLFTKRVRGKDYKVGATVTKVEAPIVTIDENNFSFEGPGYPVTISGNGTIYVKIDKDDKDGSVATDFEKVEVDEQGHPKPIYVKNNIEAYAIDANNTETVHSKVSVSKDKAFDPAKPFAAWVYETGYNSMAVSDHVGDKVYQGIKEQYNVVDVPVKDKNKEWSVACPSLRSADLLVISEMVSGSTKEQENNMTSALLYSIERDLVRNMNTLNMKMFTYGSSQNPAYRWGWGQPVNYTEGVEVNAEPTDKMLEILSGIEYNEDGKTFPLWTRDHGDMEHMQPSTNFQAKAPEFIPLIKAGENHLLHYAVVNGAVKDDDADAKQDYVYVGFGLNVNDYSHYHDNVQTIVSNICQMIKEDDKDHKYNLDKVITQVPAPDLTDNGDGSAKVVSNYNLATTYYYPVTVSENEGLLKEKGEDWMPSFNEIKAFAEKYGTIVRDGYTDKYPTDVVIYAVSAYEDLDNSDVVKCDVKGNTERRITYTIDENDKEASGRTIVTTYSVADNGATPASSELSSASVADLEKVDITIRHNTSFRKEGYTVISWVDRRTGTIYKPEAVAQTNQDLYLVAQWEKNTHKITDLSSETEEQRTVKWHFRQNAGAPSISVQWAKNRTDEEMKAFLVGQIHFKDNTFIDVVLDIDASDGVARNTPYTPETDGKELKTSKFNNDTEKGTCQINNNTKFTFPAVYGMTVNYKGDPKASKAFVSGSELTDGTQTAEAPVGKLTNPVYQLITKGDPQYVDGVDENKAMEIFNKGGIFEYTGETADKATLTSLESALDVTTEERRDPWTRGNCYMEYLAVTYPGLYGVKAVITPEKSNLYNEASAKVTVVSKGRKNTNGNFVSSEKVEITIEPAYSYSVDPETVTVDGGTIEFEKNGDGEVITDENGKVTATVTVDGKNTVDGSTVVNVKMLQYNLFSYNTYSSPSDGGTVTISSGAQGNRESDYTKFAEGKTITLKASPKVGYKFVKWVDRNNNNAQIRISAADDATDNEKTWAKYYSGLGITEVEGNTLKLTVGMVNGSTNYCNNQIGYTAVFERGKKGTVTYALDAAECIDVPRETWDGTSLKKMDQKLIERAGFPETKEDYAIVLPKYYTIYAKDYTLDAWICSSYTNAEGTEYGYTAESGHDNYVGKVYNIGDFYYFETEGDKITLKPIFRKDSENFDYRTTETTVHWDFRKNEYAQEIDFDPADEATWGSQKEIHYSTHAFVNNSTTAVDVPVIIRGEFNTQRLADWGRIGEGTEIVIPSGIGAKFMIATRNPITTSTIDGQKIDKGDNWAEEVIDGQKLYVYTYETKSPSTTVTLKIGDDFGYYKYLRAILPSADNVQLLAKVNNPAMGGLKIHKVYSAYGDMNDDTDITAKVLENAEDKGQGNILYNLPLGSRVVMKTDREHYYKVKGWNIADNLTMEGSLPMFNENAEATGNYYGNEYKREQLLGTEDATQNEYGVRRENELLTFRMSSYELGIQADLDAYDTYQLTFTSGVDAEGEAPGVQIIEENETFKIPEQNRHLYYKGHTMKYWVDAEAKDDELVRYDFGKEYTPGVGGVPARHITLTPVFERNAFFLKDITSETVATWELSKAKGAPTLVYQQSAGILVTQIRRGDEWIDLKLDITSPDKNAKITNDAHSDYCVVSKGAKFTVPTTGNCDVMVTPVSGRLEKTVICGTTGYESKLVRIGGVDMNRASVNYAYTVTANGKKVTYGTRNIEFADDVTGFNDITVKYKNTASVQLPVLSTVTVGNGELPKSIVNDLIKDKELVNVAANMQNNTEMPFVKATVNDESLGSLEFEQATVEDPVATIYLKTSGGMLVDVYEIKFDVKTATIKPKLQVVSVGGEIATKQTEHAYYTDKNGNKVEFQGEWWKIEKQVSGTGIITMEFDRVMEAVNYIDAQSGVTFSSPAGKVLSFNYWDLKPGQYGVVIPMSELQDAYEDGNGFDKDVLVRFTVASESLQLKRRLFDYVVVATEDAEPVDGKGVVTKSNSRKQVASQELLDNLDARGIKYGTVTEGVNLGNARDLYLSSKDRYYMYVPVGEFQLLGNENVKVTESGVKNDGKPGGASSLGYFNNGMNVIQRNNISIIGEDKEKTVLWNKPYIAGQKLTGTLHTFPGTSNFYAQDFTLENRYDYRQVLESGQSSGHAVSLWDQGLKSVLKNVALKSWQSTYYGQFYNTSEMAPDTRGYLETCDVYGASDPIYGDGDIWFEKCNIILREAKKNQGGVNIVNARQTSGELWGFILNECEVKGETPEVTEAQNGKFTLARPKENSPAVAYLHTTFYMNSTVDGYRQTTSKDNDGFVLRLREFDTWMIDNAGNRKLVDLSGRSLRNSNPAPGSLAPVMTAEEAKAYNMHDVLGGTDAYDPMSLTEQRPAVKNPQVIDYVLQWVDDAEALCYFIYKSKTEDGPYNLVDITTDNTLSVERYGDCYFKIRAANQMGGLGEISEAVHAIEGQRYYLPVKQVGTVEGKGWATICLPYNASVPEGVAAYAVTEIKGKDNIIVLKRVNKITADQGYVVYGDVYAGKKSADAEDTQEDKAHLFKEIMHGDIESLLPGNSTEESIDATNINCFVLNYKAKYGVGFFKFAGTTLKPYSAWLPLSLMVANGYDAEKWDNAPTVGDQNSIRIVFEDWEEDVPTDIIEIQPEEKTDERIYTIYGQRISREQMRRGEIYIVNGVKIRM